MKKRLWTGILAAALVFSIGSASVLAAEPQSPDCPGHYTADGAWVSFVDENGDGICDYFASGACGGGYGCSTGSHGGHHQGRGLRNSQCLWHTSADGSWVRFADADGGGVCDTCGVTLPQGAGFIDADGDGICDHFGPGTGGNYAGTGRRGGGCRR